jgi:c-di-GMP-binding flagellar brake protein YcgR
MITIFNRKELLVTLDMARQSEVRNILADNGIKYSVKVVNLQSASVLGSNRSRVGSYGVNQKFSYEYKIYVHKRDYENALHLIG